MKYITAALLLLISSTALGVCDADGCTGKPSELFSSILVAASDGGRVYLQAPADKANLDCTLREGKYVTLLPTHILFKEVYSALLTAVATDKLIYVRIKNGSSVCEVSYIKMYL